MLSKQNSVSRDIYGYVLVLPKATHHVWDEFRSFMYLSCYGKYCKGGSGSSCIPILVWIAFCARSFLPISFIIACPCKVLIHAETEIGKFLSKRNIGSCAFCFLDFQIKSIGRGDSFHDREGMDLMIGSFESCNAHSCFP